MDAIAKVHPRPRPTLGAYLAFAFTALSVLLTILLTIVIEGSASAQLGAAIGANLAELASQTTSRIDRGVFERYREVQLMAERLGRQKDGRAMQVELDAMQGSYRYYAWIGVADRQGIVRSATRGMLDGANVSSRPWFEGALAGRHLGDVHEAMLLARLLGGEGPEPPRFFDVAFPLGGSAGGVLGAHVSWDWAKDLRDVIFGPVGRTRRIDPLIVSVDGVVLMGPRGLEGKKLQLLSLQRAQAGQTGHLTERWPDGGEYVVGYSKSRGYGPSPGLGWTVLVRQDTEEALAPLRELQLQVLGSGITIALLFSFMGWLVARGITAPLRDLEDAATAARGGGASTIASSQAYREVASLGATLNALVSEVHTNEAALRELNAGLERRVADRTAELQAAFERVLASERRIRTILEAAQDPFIAVDLGGRIIDWNSQAESVFGWTREEAIGQPADMLLPQRYAGAVDLAMREVQNGGNRLVNRPIERVMVDRAGREIPVEVKAGYVDAGGQPFFGAFVHDISQRKEVERLKDEFVSTVSHELRTPLTATYASLSLLHSGMAGALPPDAQQLVAISHESTERLIRLINDMLDVEKIASGKLEYRMEAHDLRPLVEQAIRDTAAYAGELGVAIHLRPDGGARVLADADRIVQACVNLISNAAKFSPRGGSVAVELGEAAGWAKVTVIDHGAGISPEFERRVFERFAQADASDRRAKGGTGLGLNICKSIVEAHGGQIGFESEPGVRTAFWFTLPMAA